MGHRSNGILGSANRRIISKFAEFEALYIVDIPFVPKCCHKHLVQRYHMSCHMSQKICSKMHREQQPSFQIP